jgi:Tol biopolymer transport system component
MRVRCRGLAELFFCLFSGFAAAGTSDVSGILDSLASVHGIGEVAISPDGKHVIYGTFVAGKRGGADVDVSALWIAGAQDGSGANRLTACARAVCDEHGAAWSPDGTHIAFITTDKKDQAQVAVASVAAGNAKIITDAHGPLDTPRWSPEGDRIAFLYSEGAPKTPGPLNPLELDSGVLSSTVYEQRLAVVPAGGGAITLLGPLRRHRSAWIGRR